MKNKLINILLMATSAINFGSVLKAQDNPWGLVYENAITENTPGKVNIHPVTYNLDSIEIAANVYTPADYNPQEKQYPAIIIAHPNGGTKEQVAGLFAQRMAEKGY
ncbi:alpha/beta hydrolase, partial [uncultured Muribaculum sp.]|uniref:alpha/beta hydrolase n=1 Tax=uncultured Muribaculum sp. TaxID=1918613 RepID=UPI002594769D